MCLGSKEIKFCQTVGFLNQLLNFSQNHGAGTARLWSRCKSPSSRIAKCCPTISSPFCAGNVQRVLKSRIATTSRTSSVQGKDRCQRPVLLELPSASLTRHRPSILPKPKDQNPRHICATSTATAVPEVCASEINGFCAVGDCAGSCFYIHFYLKIYTYIYIYIYT